MQQTFSPDEKRITLLGVMLVFLLSALDQTIVSTAMPKIVGQLQGLNLYAWVTTGYMLASTVVVPIYGKLNDLYGRKPVLVAGVLIFATGSALCGLAGEFGPLPLLGGGMTQLIVFRIIQGLGGGALFTSAFAIIGDLYTGRDRARLSGLLGGVMGLASIMGPLIGGFFTDLGTVHLGGAAIAGWRWVFYVNLPISALALFMVLAKMPRLTHRAPGKIDFPGAALIVATFVPLLLALSWGGRDAAWTSPKVLGLLGVSAASLLAFLWVESVVVNPILSLALFRNRVFSTANAAAFFTALVFMGAVSFLPLYMQLGQGVAATTSGLSMLPLMLGNVASSTLSGQFISRTGRYKPVLLLGSALIIAGLLLISRANAQTSSLDLAWRVLILGVGLGPSMSTFSLAVQNAVPRSQLGVATSSAQFFRQIGGTVGVALFGAILSHNLAGSGPGGAAAHLNLAALQGAASTGAAHAASLEARAAITHAVTSVFGVGAILAVIALGIVLLIPGLPLDRAEPTSRPAPEPV